MSLLDDISRQEHILVKHMDAARVTHRLLELLAQKQIWYKYQFQMTWILSYSGWVLHIDDLLDMFNYLFNLVLIEVLGVEQLKLLVRSK